METYSGGLSLSDSTRLWDDEILGSEGGVSARIFGEFETPKGTVAFQSEANNIEAMQRVFSCLVISQMPASGLNETVDKLRELYGYYVESEWQQLPEPSGMRQVRGKVVTKSVRPGVLITE
jgi:hypothetical protein